MPFKIVVFIISKSQQIIKTIFFPLSDPTVLSQMSGKEFERFICKLLQANGFKEISLTPPSGDYGIDIIAYQDKLKYCFQCKRYTNKVGIKAIQEAKAGSIYYKSDYTIVVTNSHFSNNAKILADNNDVILWDIDNLSYLMTKTNLYPQSIPISYFIVLSLMILGNLIILIFFFHPYQLISLISLVSLLLFLFYRNKPKKVKNDLNIRIHDHQ